MKKPSLAITAVVAAYLALALTYGVVVPPFEGLDEVEHFGVVRYVADTGRLPVQGDAALAAYRVRQEASQPPLYYLVAGPLLRLTGISTADTGNYLVPNPYVTCGTESIRANKAILRRDPFAEAFPWHTALLALHLLRVFSAALQAFTVVGVYVIARRVFPNRPGVASLAAALTAFNPQFLVVASNVNNDNVATPVITWAVYLCIVIVQEGLTLKRALITGLLIGLAALAKLAGLLLLPLVALGVILNLKPVDPKSTLRNQKPPKVGDSEIRNLLILIGAVIVVSSWWYIRNGQLYGDPTGLNPMLDIVGRRGLVPLGLLLSELSLVFRSYWGQFPCAFFDSSLYYSAWALVAALGLVGLVMGLRRERATIPLRGSRTRIAPYVLGAWLALVFFGWVRWNLTTPAPGGRLLFSAVGATSTLLAYGLISLTTLYAPRSSLFAYMGAGAMFIVGTIALPMWVRPLFAPPPMMDVTRVNPQHPLKAQFGESIGLLGYDLSASGLGPGHFVDVTLYWRALKPMSTDYVLALQLAALAPGDTRTLLNFNTWPGGGNLPTAAWPVGPVIADRYRVPLPQDTGATQAWRLQALLYDVRTGTRLPLTLDGQPGGPALTLDVVRVAGTQIATSPDSARLTTPVTFDQVIALTHARVDDQSGAVRVQLLWQSIKPLPRDVTVFVHAYDATGQLVTTGDGPPMKGNFPTSLWQPGDLVLDEHTLALPAGLALNDVQVKVGLYRLEDTLRLETRQGASRLPEDAVTVWPR
jgi:4-amino-4-deoxy-L-arabinose transferase-like glycosyltransferase